MNNLRKPILLSLALALAGCGAADTPSDPPLAGARIGGPFRLINQDGRSVSDGDFAGRYRAIYFGYTYCPDVCPVDVQNLMRAYQSFATAEPEQAKRLAPIFISIDPARDRPPELKQFAAAFPGPLTALTGTEAQIAEVARAYGVAYMKREPEAGMEGYLVDHARLAMLLGPKGEPIALLPTEESAEAVLREFQTWVK